MTTQTADNELKARHRTMWASSDYPQMVDTFLLPLGPRLVEACHIESGAREGLTRAERDELVRLRRENRVLRMEKEILGKAAAFFATENGHRPS